MLGLTAVVARDARKPSLGAIVLFGCVCAAAGLALRYHALFVGFAADDYVQLAMINGTYAVERPIWDLYNFSDGSVEEGKRLRRQGFYPWFAHQQLRLSMFRPLASLMIYADSRLLGTNALLYHVHTALWWTALVVVVARLLFMTLPPLVAGLACILFAADEAHTVPLAWLANRCAITATFFGVLGVIAYVRFRESGGARRGLVCGGVFLLALGFGEYALCAAPYAFAFELDNYILERRRRRSQGQRSLRAERIAIQGHAVSLLPFWLPTLLYLGTRAALHRGPLHSGIYISPGESLTGFLDLVLRRLPVLVADLFLGTPAEMWTFGNMFAVRPHRWGLVGTDWLLTPGPWRTAHSSVGLVVVVLAVVVWRWLRGVVQHQSAASTDERAVSELPAWRWLVWGSPMALLPVLGSFPSSRVLVASEIGGAAVIAGATLYGLARARERFVAAPRRAVVLGAACALFGLYHLVWPAYASHVDSASMRIVSLAARRAVLRMEVDTTRLPSQRVVVLTAREYGTSLYVPFTRAIHGLAAPASCWTISITPAPHTLARDSATSFLLAPDDGYRLLSTAPEQLMSDPREPFQRGDVVDLGGLRVTIIGVEGTLVSVIRVEADVPLEDPSLYFVVPTHSGIVRFQLPEIGRAVLLPEPALPRP